MINYPAEYLKSYYLITPMTQNFKAFLNLSKRMQRKYEGQYIIMIDGKIVSHGKQIDTPLPTIKRKYPEKIPLITKIPRAEAMIL